MASSSPPRNAPFGEWKTPKRAEIRALGRIKGLSIRRIAEVTGVPRSSVCRIINFAGPRRARATRNGRRHIISERQLRRLIRRLRTNWRTRCLPLVPLAKECDIKASKSTIQRVLAKAGYHRCVACPRPFINKKQQNKRLKFAQEHIDLDEDVLRRVIWSDECTFETGKRGRIWVTRKAGERYCQDCMRSVYRSGRTSIMIWGAIGWGYKSPLVFLEKVEGSKGYNSTIYRDQVLIPVVTPMMEYFNEFEEPAIFMEDGSRIHEGFARRYRLQMDWELLRPWPPSSPDFNLIEKVWRHIKLRITQRYPFPTSLEGLRQAIQEEWDAIDPMDFMGPLEKWRDIMRACIDQKGLATRF